MGTSSPFDEIALKAKVADLSRRLAEAEEALQAAASKKGPDSGDSDGQRELLLAAERTLSMEQNLLRTVIDIIPDRVFVRDSLSRHVINNAAQLELMGAKSLDETIGKTEADYYGPELAKSFIEGNLKVVSDGVTLSNIEQMIPDPRGKEQWWSTTKAPLRDASGKVVGVVGIARNVTERVQDTRKITEQAAMLDQAHDAILMLSLEGRIAYANPAAEELFGFPSGWCLGKTAADMYPPEDVANVKHAQEETLKKGSWSGELRVHRRDGRELHLETRRSLILDEKGKPKAQLSMSVDITERKRRDAIALRAQRLESLGTLAGGIAHDLNNVLAPILMSIALLKLKVSDESGHRLLAMLEKNAERGAQLVRQVLAFGRGAEGERVPIQTLHIAREIEQIVNDTFSKAISFELTSERKPWTVTGDPTQIHQVLLNLCVNARDAMPNGGKITLGIEHAVVDETFAAMNHGSKPGSYVMIAVTDTGAGIPHGVRDRIFEPFFTTKAVGKGTGLGLSTSLGIIQSHGGFINVATDLGKGSTFRIFLPASEGQEPAERPPARKRGLPRGQNELIMVVDDEQPILNVAKSTLERFGYRVVTATNGAEAVSEYALKRDGIAVVVTDMSMPIMDGPAMAVALVSINPKVKIIGSSGMNSGFSPKVAVEAGVREFIPKPYSAETLLKAIARAIGRSEEGEEAD